MICLLCCYCDFLQSFPQYEVLDATVLAPKDGMRIGAAKAKGTHMDDALWVVVVAQLTVENSHETFAALRACCCLLKDRDFDSFVSSQIINSYRLFVQVMNLAFI